MEKKHATNSNSNNYATKQQQQATRSAQLCTRKCDQTRWLPIEETGERRSETVYGVIEKGCILKGTTRTILGVPNSMDDPRAREVKFDFQLNNNPFKCSKNRSFRAPLATGWPKWSLLSCLAYDVARGRFGSSHTRKKRTQGVRWGPMASVNTPEGVVLCWKSNFTFTQSSRIIVQVQDILYICIKQSDKLRRHNGKLGIKNLNGSHVNRSLALFMSKHLRIYRLYPGYVFVRAVSKVFPVYYHI